MPDRRARFAALALALAPALAAAVSSPLSAQRYVRPERDWVTLRTKHFRLHAPRELVPWTRRIAERMEDVRAAELRVIGFVPPAVTDVVVEDPLGDPNGSAYPFLDGPAVFLWPVPPTPRSFVGNSREWGEILAVHEFAHIAHLTRPSRNRLQQLWRSVLPGRIGPVATRSPRWAIEGYATYVEGALTGSGRPHAALRAAVLRQWALEGRLPTYAAMSGASGGYLSGSFAYLMGSAYLEWLGAERGDSSLTALWRRLSARQNRSFDEAFAGVWGEAPAILYGRFAARTTAAAFAEWARLEAAGLVEGAPYQRLARGTGDPAVSPDGRRVAVTLAGSEGQPSRVVLWRAGADAQADTAADSAYARRVRRLLRRDPEDVAPVRVLPAGKAPVATLAAVGGRGHHDPRFLADGRVLVWRDEPTPDGVLRPDLFVWHPARAALRRVTRGANVRQADPAPDGRSAAAVRCDAGTCALVRVDLVTGAVSALRAGSPDSVWTRPRWSPDGTRLVAGLQAGGRWRVVVLDPSAPGAAPRPVGPTDDAERYDATFTPDGRAVVYVSEAGGIPNLARATLDAPAAETPLTRVTSAAFAPVASGADGSWLFLHLTPRGLDVRRLHPDSTPVRGATVAVLTAPSLLPRGEAALTSAIAQRPPVTVPRFAVGTVTEEPYGVGPRHHAVLPFGDAAPGGGSYGLQFGSLDPAGRLTWLAQGAGAVRRGWSGGSLRAAWRGLPVTVVGEGFALAQDLGASPGAAGGPVPVAVRDDARWAGGSFIAEGVRWRAAGGGATRGPAALPSALDARLTARAGASAGHLTLAPSGAASAPDLPDARERRRGTRALGFAELGARLAGAQGTRTLALSLDAHGSTGRTHDAGWRRGVARAHVAGGASRFGIALDGLLGATSAGAPAWEQFALGGNDPGLVDDAVLSQRIALPALPTATQVGPRVAVARAALTTRGLEPYVAWAQAGDDFRGRWQRVLGVESHVATPFVPFARAPRARLTLGVGYSLDEPIRERVRGYFRVAYLP